MALRHRLALTVERHFRTVFLTVEGEIDAFNCEQLELSVKDWLRTEPILIELDLTSVTFVSGTAIAALETVAAACKAAGVRLDVRRSPAVEHVMSLLSLQRDESPIVIPEPESSRIRA